MFPQRDMTFLWEQVYLLKGSPPPPKFFYNKEKEEEKKKLWKIKNIFI
jgi:hypothetical protein